MSRASLGGAHGLWPVSCARRLGGHELIAERTARSTAGGRFAWRNVERTIARLARRNTVFSLRLLHLIPSLSSGGAERQLQYLAQGLSERGHAVHVGYLHLGPDERVQVCAQLHRIRAVGNYDPSILGQLWTLMARLKPDIVQTWIMQMDVLGGLVATARGERWIIREPNEALAYRRSWKFRARERVGRRARAILCNSDGGRQYWTGVAPGKPTFVVRNALPAEAIGLARPAAVDLFGLDPKLPIVLYAGRLVADHTSDKNLTTLVSALRLLRGRTRVQALLCGEGPQRGQLEREIERLGLHETVKLSGHLPRERLWGLLQVATAFVSVSRFEGMPNAVMEAMVAGCPLVLSDIGAHRELVSQDSALLVASDRPDAIAQAIEAVLGRPEEARIRAARAKARTHTWTLAAAAADCEQVYDAVLGASRLASC